MTAPSQVDGADLIDLLESDDIKTVTATQALINENLQNGKEVWLLNGLVDSYVTSKSEKVPEIIASVREPHDKHFFDRLMDHLRGSHKLQSIDLLAKLVLKRPPWLHKITRHQSLMSHFIKIMKTETDVKILMSGVLTITMLLPCAPVLMRSYLPDVFEIFARLVEFHARKPGGVHDVYLLHLQVGIYCLFHRFYGMYPCHLLTYLREKYCRTDQMELFHKAVKPMLEKVRMHPLLVVTTKDKEVTPERWKRKETHDIIVECAELSLDLNEGTCEVSAKPRIESQPLSEANRLEQAVMSPKQFTSDASKLSVKVEPLKLGAEPLILTPQMDKFWSPSVECGLSTPPPNSKTQTFDLSGSDQHQSQLLLSDSTHVTPNVLDCPFTPSSDRSQATPHDDQMEGKGDKFFQTPDRNKPALQKRLSHMTMSLSGKFGEANQAEECVPLSPLKPDFSTDHPLGVQRSQAIRKISFDGPSCEDAKEKTSSQEDASVPSVPSVKNLSQFIESLDVNTGPPDKDEDAEVSELTGDVDNASEESDGDDHPSHIPESVEMTTESVKAFMKQVNRIKFNSMTAQREPKAKNKTVSRATSCPDLAEGDAQTAEDTEASVESRLSRIRSSTARKEVEDSALPGIGASATQVVETCVPAEVVNTKSFAEYLEEMKSDLASKYPYLEFIPEVLPYLPIMQQRAKESSPEENKPLFTRYSPTDLLDRHIEFGNDVHAKELSQIPLPSTDTVNWTHFGGVPPADEVNILRGQIMLLHNQLLYERNRRQLHAQRNRRLLTYRAKNTLLEEQASAMSDTLHLQEKALESLQKELKGEHRRTKDEEEKKDSLEAQLKANEKASRQEMENLKKQNEHLRKELEAERQRNADVTKELKCAEAELFSQKKELDSLRIKASRTAELQNQVGRLNKELLLMGELQQRYQQRLGDVSKSHNVQPEVKFLVESLRAELEGVRLLSDQRLVALDNTRAKLAEKEEALKQQEAITEELKKQMENQNKIHSALVQSLEEKYTCQKSIQITLQAEILTLENKVSRLERPAQGEVAAQSRDKQGRRRTIPVSPSTTSVSSTELADEATVIDGTSPPFGLSPSTSSAFQSYQSARAREMPGEHGASSDEQ